MEGPSLTAACYTAFAVVFTVLAFLALVIHVVTLVFPARAPRTDPAVVAGPLALDLSVPTPVVVAVE